MKKHFLCSLLTIIIFLSFSKIAAQDFWQATNGLAGTTTNSIVVNSKGYIFAGTDNGVYRSTDNGNNWTLTSLDTWVNTVVKTSGDQIFAGTDTLGVCRSTNDGNTWVPVSSKANFVLYIQVATNGDIFYSNSIGELFKSTDNGNAWNQVCYMPNPTAMWAFAKDLSGNLFIGTYDQGAFSSTDNGSNWQGLIQKGLTDTTIWTFTVNNSGHIFAGTSEGIFRSINNGINWTQINNGLTTLNTWTLCSNESGHIYAGTSGSGVYQSTDNGNNWKKINGGLTDSSILYLYSDHNGYLWAGTYGGVFRSKSTTVIPTTININTNINFGDASKQTSYQMIGLPGNLDLPLSQAISGSADKDWTAYWDNGAEQGSTYLVKHDGTNVFNFKPGRAFWLLSKNSFTVNRNVNAVTLTNNYFPITLHSGWNLISNPFNINVNWDDVKLLNGVTQPIHNYSNGSYIRPATFEPYNGYYFINDLNLQTLKIPFGPGLMPYFPSPTNIEKLTTNISLRLTLKSDDGKDESVETIFNNGSTEGLDELDVFAPPNNFLEKSITIINNNLSNSYKYLMVDSRKEIGEGQSYDLNIKNKIYGKTFIKVDGIENFNNYEIYLVDNNLNKFYNLKESHQLNLSIYHKEYNFSLLIGNEEFIKNKQIELKPTRYELFQNFPNPFNPFTTIKFSLPVQSEVKISLFNSLGETVEVLSNKILSAGYHEINFDGSKLSSGIYYYSISAKSADGKDTFNKVRKMILLK